MPTLLSMAGLKEEIPASVQGVDLSEFFYTPEGIPATKPKAVLYLRNQGGETDEDSKMISYFPAARGVKTATHTMAITIDKQNRIKEVLLFDDINDPYQLNSLPYKEHPELFASLCKEMAILLQKAGDPWVHEFKDFVDY